MLIALRLRITFEELTKMNDETKVSHKQEQQQVENGQARELTESELAKVSGGLKPATRGKLKVRGGDDDLDDLEVER
jgi:bacteriocin-like protein